jgi:monofunctional biosynthetic peptidoglycan transglycosylase
MPSVHTDPHASYSGNLGLRAIRWRRPLRRLFRLALVLLALDLVYLAWIWPDWGRYARGPIPKSHFIALYEEARREQRDWPELQWQPVALAEIPRVVQRAVIVAEDWRFYEHGGFDLVAIREALDYNLARGRIVRGASTISQQTVKNLFLHPSRDPLRKWHELTLTFGLEQNLSKMRILELYLNSVEFGRGIYGVQAAALAYWGVGVGELGAAQAAELAATLPGPVQNNPRLRTETFLRRANRILALLAREFDVPSGLIGPQEPDAPEPPSDGARGIWRF